MNRNAYLMALFAFPLADRRMLPYRQPYLQPAPSLPLQRVA